MQLTKQTDYAFRVLIYLYAIPQGDKTNIQTICKLFDISKSHVMKVVQKLASHGFVRTVRGANGGICLGKDAGEINLRAVVELMETTLTPFNCTHPQCRILHSCKLKEILNGAQNSYLKNLEQFTLKDIVNTNVQKDLDWPSYQKSSVVLSTH